MRFLSRVFFLKKLGIGLTVSRLLVGLLGPDEKIEYKSEVGKGSVFSFRIYQNMTMNCSTKMKVVFY